MSIDTEMYLIPLETERNFIKLTMCVCYIYIYIYIHIYTYIGEGNGNPLQCSCLENPRDRGAWWAAVSGVA